MKAEKFLALSAPAFRLARPAALKGCAGVYLGDEFCQNLLPSGEDLGLALDRCKGRAALVTPLLTDEVFDRVEALVRAFSSARRPLELVANDLGLLHALRGQLARRVRISLGRVLGHRIKVTPAAWAAAFLRRHRVVRAELDDPALLPRLAAYGVKLSFHSPFRYISVTRFCPWELHWPAPCGFACLGKVRRLDHPRLPQPLLLKGQAYGVRGGAAPRHPLLDRAVAEPLPGGGR